MWVRRAVQKGLARLEEDRDYAAIGALFESHVAAIEKLQKGALGPAGKPVAEHLTKELATLEALRREKGW